jgi:hypothetical protein
MVLRDVLPVLAVLLVALAWLGWRRGRRLRVLFDSVRELDFASLASYRHGRLESGCRAGPPTSAGAPGETRSTWC